MPELQTISDALNILESDAEKLINLCAEMANAHNGDMYPFDLLANGAANRSIALSAGFRIMIREKNLICAGAILRLQLDTSFRFFAGFLVNDPHQFAKDVLEGKQIRKMTDMDGNQLTDAYLVKRLSEEFSWVKPLYDYTCEYIHLSGTHISHAIDGTVQDSTDGSKTIVTKFGAVDRELPVETYLEAIMAFQQSSLVFVRYLNGWIFTKNNPELVARLKVERDTAYNTT